MEYSPVFLGSSPVFLNRKLRKLDLPNYGFFLKKGNVYRSNYWSVWTQPTHGVAKILISCKRSGRWRANGRRRRESQPASAPPRKRAIIITRRSQVSREFAPAAGRARREKGRGLGAKARTAKARTATRPLLSARGPQPGPPTHTARPLGSYP